MPPSRIIDLTGKQYDRLTVLCYAGRIYKNNIPSWYCLCTCGTVVQVSSYSLTKEYTKSCGCLSVETRISNNTTHGFGNSVEYKVWSQAKTRCYNKNHPRYKSYGGRGIGMCDRWKESFSNFLEDVGFRPEGEYSFDRINNNGNYSPENCRWTTRKEQIRNRRNTLYCNYRGKVVTLIEACEKTGIAYRAAYYALYVKDNEDFMGITKQ